MRKGPNLVRIGAIGVVVLGMLTYLGFTKRIPFTHGFRIKGEFQSSNQLISGSPVRIAGVDVGRVASIEPGRGTTQLVELQIKDKALPVHADATLRIRPRLFLEGGFMVEIDPGSPSAPILEDGSTLPLKQTAIPVQFHQVLGALNRPTRDALKDVVDELDRALDGGGAEALGRAAKPLAPALRDTAVVAEAARGVRAHDLSDGIGATSRITAALASRDDELADLVTGLRVTTGALAAEDRALAATLRELDGFLGAAPEALRSLDRSLPSLDRFGREVRPALRIAPPVLRDANRLLVQLDGLVSARELPRVVRLLRPSLGTLPELERRLGDLFPLVTPVTDCVRDKALPVLLAKLDDGHLSSGRPVWQDLVHGMVGLASSTSSFDANGQWLRYLAGGGEQTVSTGSIPLAGTLYGTTSQPVLGSRPRWVGRLGPDVFRPDQPCTAQAAPKLEAATGPAMRRTGRARRGRPASARKLRRLLADLPIRKRGSGR